MRAKQECFSTLKVAKKVRSRNYKQFPHPRRLECLTICRYQSKGSTVSSVILGPWVLVRSVWLGPNFSREELNLCLDQIKFRKIRVLNHRPYLTTRSKKTTTNYAITIYVSDWKNENLCEWIKTITGAPFPAKPCRAAPNWRRRFKLTQTSNFSCINTALNELPCLCCATGEYKDFYENKQS